MIDAGHPARRLRQEHRPEPLAAARVEHVAVARQLARVEVRGEVACLVVGEAVTAPRTLAAVAVHAPVPPMIS
jgi:hypothetical protein